LSRADRNPDRRRPFGDQPGEFGRGSGPIAAISPSSAPSQACGLCGYPGNLPVTRLQLARLQVADLQVADLQVADLQVADLQVADLQAANLRVAYEKFIVAAGFRRRMRCLPMEIS
jgi:hypothetical protein